MRMHKFSPMERKPYIPLQLLSTWPLKHLRMFILHGNSLRPQNPCSNHEIHVLFEHGFCLKKPKLGPDLHA